MARHERRALIAFIVGAALWSAAKADAQQPPANPQVELDSSPQWRAMQEDAELHGVFFVDAQQGWAVGDRGAIWHTADGGRGWQLQAAGTRARLAAIQMFSAQEGLAVGGIHQDYTHASGGLLLRTSDGGQTWQLDTSLMLPALHGVKFVDPLHGWAFGEPSTMFPTGVATTDNGGRSWTSVTSEAVQGWVAGDFVDPAHGAVAGQRATLAAIAGRRVDAAIAPERGLREIRKLRLDRSGKGWLVGDRGLLMATRDAGESWTAATCGITGFDWRTVAMRGPKVWIAGEPGTRVLHSSDGGASWEAFATGQSLPINDLTFIDDQRGWAVGGLGAILATGDGGRTWQRQRAGGARAAILALLGEPESAPLEFFARLAANDGYLTAVEFLARRDLDDPRPHLATLPLRAADGLSLLGVSSARVASNFPLRQAGVKQSAEQIVAAWNRVNDGQAIEQLEAHLVRQIRMWRPEMIVTHAASPRGHDTLGHLMNQVAVRAAEGAASPQRFPEQLTGQGLQPWQTKKVIGMLADGQPGRLNITTSQLAARWGCTLADLGDRSRGLLRDEYADAPATLGFQLAIDFLPQNGGSHDFMSGIVLHPGSDARRALADAPDLGTDLMRRVAQKHRNIQAILAHTGRSTQNRDALAAAAGNMTFGLDDTAAGEVLFQTAHAEAHAGRWNEAAEMFELLAKRYPRHRLTGASLVWLLRYASSAEVAHARGSGFGVQDSRAGDTPTSNAERRLPNADPHRVAYATSVGKQIEQQFPTLFAEPEVQFPWLVNLAHNEQHPDEVKRQFGALAGTRPHDAWWSCAAAETSLREQGKNDNNSMPQPVWRVAACGARPKLDGRLDEEFWQAASPIALRSTLGDDHDWPAEALAASDGKFLYLAFRCRQPDVSNDAPLASKRTRDPDLSGNERIELFLDVDRDRATWYRLVIDHRGWVAEDCWGDKSWNPTWYLAIDRTAGAWTVEAAMPLEALVREPPTPGTAWSVGIQRIVPGTGFQSWTAPAATTPMPEGFGLMTFE